MSVRRMLTALAASVLVCAVAIPARGADPRPRRRRAVKGTIKPAAAKPEAAAVAGGRRAGADRPVRHLGAPTARPPVTARKCASRWRSRRRRKPIRQIVRATPAYCVRLDAAGGKSHQRGLCDDRLHVKSRARNRRWRSAARSYAMYTQGDGLWIKNAAEEERMVDAMRKAADATVKGVSAKGHRDPSIRSR